MLGSVGRLAAVGALVALATAASAQTVTVDPAIVTPAKVTGPPSQLESVR